MNTLPDPAKLFIVVGVRQKTKHLGYYEYGKPRALCCAKMMGKTKTPPTITQSGKAGCRYCFSRLKTIYRKIKKLGVEWVCYGHYVDPQKREYSSRLNRGIQNSSNVKL